MKKELEFSAKLGRADAAGVVEALIEGLKEGRLKIERNSKVLELEVAETVNLEVSAKVKNGTASFELELSWPAEGASLKGEPEAQDVQVMEQVAQKARESVAFVATHAGDIFKEAVQVAKRAVQKGSEAAIEVAGKAREAVISAAEQTKSKVESALEKDKAAPKGAAGAPKTAPKKPAAKPTAAKKPEAKKPAKAAAKKTAAKKAAPKKTAASGTLPAKTGPSALAERPKSTPPAVVPKTSKALAKTPPAGKGAKPGKAKPVPSKPKGSA